jgi:hypothetical protein
VFGDGQPLANATVHGIGALPNLKTDASGRYRAEAFNNTAVFLWVFDERFRLQPCAAWVEPAGSGPLERTADVYLASASGALSAGSQVVAGRRRVSGTVRTMTDTGLQPVAEVSVVSIVKNRVSHEDWNAWTSTDIAGRFSMCGLPIDQRLFIYSDIGSDQWHKWASTDVEPGSGDADIELVLQKVGKNSTSALLMLGR